MKISAMALLGVGIISSPAWAGDDAVERARQLVGQGHAAEAIQLLEPVPADKAADADYAYVAGTAALDAGQYAKAILYLQRVVALDPKLVGARVDLGRAYFAMGSYGLAEREFRAAEQANPPEAVREGIRRHLAAIAQRQTTATGGLTGYLEAGLGYDGNITSVTGDFTGGVLAAYNLAGVTPTGNSVKRSGGYASLAGGLALSHPLGKDLALFASLDGRDQEYGSGNRAFSSQSVAERVGLAYTAGSDLLRAALGGQQYRQDAAAAGISNDRDSLSLSGEWYRQLDARNRLGAFYQYTEYRYATQANQDVDQNLYGVSWTHAYGGAGAPQVSASLYQSVDRARHKLNPATQADVGKTVTGISVGGQYSLDNANDLFATLGYARRDDDSAFARSTVTAYGHDDLWSFSIGGVHRFDRNWSVRAQLSYSDNRSDIALYSYQRTDASVVMRYDFR